MPGLPMRQGSSSSPEPTARFRAPGAGVAILGAALNLANEAATIETVEALREAGVRTVVLKGPLARRWLYGTETTQSSLDIDLLVRWDDMPAVDRVLPRLGWRYLGTDLAGKPRPECRIWQRVDSGLGLDLHRSIAGVGVSDDELWQLLSAETEQALVGGRTLEVLAPPARAMHLALHAAQHGAGHEQPLRDLWRGLDVLPDRIWERAAELAARLDATAAFAMGLALSPRGERLIERLGLRRQASPEAMLLARAAPPMAIKLEWLARLRGPRAKAAFLLRHVVPPAGYMRIESPLARRGAAGLLAAYVWRPIRLARDAGPALRAWRTARRSAEAEK